MSKKIHFANLSVTQKGRELLDYGDIVVDAVLKNQQPRRTSSAIYHFMDVDIGFLEPDNVLSLSIYGRFVKSTTLSSEQELVNGRIVPRHVQIPTAPSAFFVFNLADHRISLMEETRNAPTIRTFGNTLTLFIKRRYELVTRSMWKEALEQDDKVTLKSIIDSFPPPFIRLVPISGKVEIDAFLKRFSKIRSLSIDVIKRNQDMSRGGIFDALAEDIAELGPASSKLQVNGGQEGLNPETTTSYLGDLAEHGYEDAKIKGTDHQGSELVGSNSEFSLTRSVDEPSQDPFTRAMQINGEYKKAKETGQIKLTPRDAEKLAPILRRLADRHG